MMKMMIVKNIIKRGGFHASAIRRGIIPFKLADIGEGIAEVQVLDWYVAEGTVVKQFDKIAEVQSDKATVEITSRYDGVVKKLHYAKGDTAKVGNALIDIEVAGAAAPEPSVKAVEKESGSAPSVTEPREQRSSDIVRAMPGTRHLAKKMSINLANVRGTGRSGQVTREDVLHAASGGAVANTLQLTAFQKAMVKSMKASLGIPHFGFHDEIGVDKVIALRDELKEQTLKIYNIKLTPMAFYIKALSLALGQFPTINSHFDANNMQVSQFVEHNISIAVDTAHGLAVPVIKGAQNLSIVEIATELGRLTEAARINKLQPADLTGGTIALSNIGSIGGTTATPVIISPQVAIVALGKVALLPRFNEAMQVAPTRLMPISWSADHRIVDGATIARFSQRWKELIESPTLLLPFLYK